jgi:protease IV
VTMRRGAPVVFGLIGVAMLVSVAVMVLLYQAVARGGLRPQGGTLVLRPGGDLPEQTPDDVVGQFLDRGTGTVQQFVETLRRAKTDARIAGVLIAPATLDLPYWAKLQELRDAVFDFRTSGKPVTAFLEYGGDREYYLASAADKVYLLRSSPLDLTGIASYEVFLRGAFDKVGVQPDYLHVGEYKSAPNQLTERSMPPAHREMAESLNRDTYDQMVGAVAAARRKRPEEIRALIDRAPFTPEAALEAGFVDGLAYADELDEQVPALKDLEDRQVDGDDYGRAAPGRPAFRRRPQHRIAVIYAVGTIVSGDGGYDATDGALIGSDTLTEDIRRVRDDDSIDAVVLRIDSPGGSSVASDVIWRELMLLRQDDASRPLVASMSDLAASGGYYIAMPADAIVAQPGTLTGSIGIYTGKIALGGALAKLGIAQETIKSGANADIYSPFAPFTPPQRQKVQVVLDAFYQGFVQKAAESRKMTTEQLDAVARGRVWTGRQARERGLVDALGGLDAAIALAKERAEIPEGDAVEIVVYPRKRSFYQALSDQLGGAATVSVWSALVGGTERKALAALTAPVRLFRRGEPLALMPFTFVR